MYILIGRVLMKTDSGKSCSTVPRKCHYSTERKTEPHITKTVVPVCFHKQIVIQHSSTGERLIMHAKTFIHEGAPLGRALWHESAGECNSIQHRKLWALHNIAQKWVKGGTSNMKCIAKTRSNVPVERIGVVLNDHVPVAEQTHSSVSTQPISTME